MKNKLSYRSFLLLLTCLCSYMLFGQIDQVDYRNWVLSNKTTATNDKIALVIGNSEYQHGGKLREPAKDAQTIADALSKQGYDVEIGYNLSRKNFYEAIRAFANKFGQYKSGIVFYAGHGFQIDGENYLIPIDAKPESQLEAQEQCINVEYFFKAINQPEKPKVVILDACRNNPFSSTSRGDNGMGSVQSMLNAKIIFSTAKNTVVKDYNPFAELLSKYILEGGCINAILGQVSREVRSINQNQQIWQEGLLEEEICFGEEKKQVPSPAQNMTAIAAPTQDAIDKDGDGLLNSIDNCPDIAGPIENRGCPVEVIGQGPSSGVLTDSRDGQNYKWVRLKDGKNWIAQNINYATPDSWYYEDKKENGQKIGRLYTWRAAQDACPKGWRLPTMQEWERLKDLYGGKQHAFKELLAPPFNIKLAGARTLTKNFCCLDTNGHYWTANATAANALYYDFNGANDMLRQEQYSKDWALSCRCVQE